MSDSEIIETEALIIGAGPVGLFQVFELGLLGIKATVLDALHVIGGQCIEFYPNKPIFDIPAIPRCTGKELIDALMEQIKPFDPQFHLSQQVVNVDKRGEGDFLVETHKGMRFHAKTVFIAAGLGAFEPRRLKIDGIDEFEEINLEYKVIDPTRYHGKDVVILGGGDSAFDWTLELAEHANVVQVHRSQKFKAQPRSVAKMQELCADFKMDFIEGTVTKFSAEDGRLTALTIRQKNGSVCRLELDELLCFYGLSPKLGAIAKWGLEVKQKSIVVDTEKFQTSVDGIYAVGDINTYPGKKKLILSGFHECALAAYAAKSYMYPDETVILQYTTTSTKMHQRLGVDDPYASELS